MTLGGGTQPYPTSRFALIGDGKRRTGIETIRLYARKKGKIDIRGRGYKTVCSTGNFSRTHQIGYTLGPLRSTLREYTFVAVLVIRFEFGPEEWA